MSGKTRYVCSYGLCGKDFITPEKLENHKKTHNSNGKYKCSHCNYTSDSKASCISHTGGHARRIEGIFICPREGCTFSTCLQASLNMHIMKKHVDDKTVYVAEAVEDAVEAIINSPSQSESSVPTVMQQKNPKSQSELMGKFTICVPPKLVFNTGPITIPKTTAQQSNQSKSTDKRVSPLPQTQESTIMKSNFPNILACNPDMVRPEVVYSTDINYIRPVIFTKCGECNFASYGDNLMREHYKQTNHHVNGVLPVCKIKCTNVDCRYTSSDLNDMLKHLITHNNIVYTLYNKARLFSTLFLNVVAAEAPVPYVDD